MRHVSAKLVSSMLHTTLSMKGLVDVVEYGAKAHELAATSAASDFDSRVGSALAHNSRNAAMAAALVFQHSACENALVDLCEALVVRDPKPWLEKIKERRVSFAQLYQKSSGEVGLELIMQFIEDLRRRSFPEKLEVIFSVLKPQAMPAVLPGFSFSMEEVKRIDKVRHALVHSPEFSMCGTNEDDVQYLFSVVQLCLALAVQKYGEPKSGHSDMGDA